MTQVRYHDAARAELLNEIHYLQQQVTGLGERLHEEVRRIEDIIRKHPKFGREINPGIRKVVLQKFQYSIFYALENDDHILVLALAHHRRRPNYWLDRLS